MSMQYYDVDDDGNVEAIPWFPRVGTMEDTEIKTKQSEAESADINFIMSKYIALGTPPPSAGMEPVYGDFSSGLDFHSAMNSVLQMKRDFEKLPLQVREACGHDPGKFIDMLYDPERIDEMEKLGLTEVYRPPGAPKKEEGAPVPDGSVTSVKTEPVKP